MKKLLPLFACVLFFYGCSAGNGDDDGRYLPRDIHGIAGKWENPDLPYVVLTEDDAFIGKRILEFIPLKNQKEYGDIHCKIDDRNYATDAYQIPSPGVLLTGMYTAAPGRKELGLRYKVWLSDGKLYLKFDKYLGGDVQPDNPDVTFVYSRSE